MRRLNFPSKQDSYQQITSHLLNVDTPLNYSLEYLLVNYGDKAVPALMQALPARPWYEQQVILDTLGKIGDIRSIVPICALIYEESISTGLSDAILTGALRSLVYHTPQRKKAITIIIDTMLKYRECSRVLTAVLKVQNDKFTIKNVYKKLFKQGHSHLKESAIIIVGEDNANTQFRIKYLKKMHVRLKGSPLKDRAIAALKILISKKRCQCLCRDKGLKFDAFFQRPDSESYDCCCVDKNNKRLLIKFEGGVIPKKSDTHF